jgi:hypothetical protein
VFTEPFVRWCGRTAGETPPPTDSKPAEEAAPAGVAGIRGFGGCSAIAEKAEKPMSLKICGFSSGAGK